MEDKDNIGPGAIRTMGSMKSMMINALTDAAINAGYIRNQSRIMFFHGPV
jgi:hypothetical protein